jgi:HD-GYP domain-containing protein (c-di-GMP phosphodiesterase class II)
VRHHHERWDGTGYPDHLSEDKIPLIARIVAVADAYDAMTSDRPYRPAMPTDRAFIELVSKAGTHFDPTCVYAFMRLRQKIEAMKLAS